MEWGRQVNPGRGPRGSLIRPGPPFDLGLFSMTLPLRSRGPLLIPWVCSTYERAIHLFGRLAGSCEQCPTRWLPFQGSCYFISALRTKWVDAQRNCSGESAHLVIVGGLEEQVRRLGDPRREAEFT